MRDKINVETLRFKIYLYFSIICFKNLLRNLNEHDSLVFKIKFSLF